MDNVGEEKKKFRFRRFIKGNGKKAFWIWVGYQAIKGTLTTSFIWIPLFYVWFTQ